MTGSEVAAITLSAATLLGSFFTGIAALIVALNGRQQATRVSEKLDTAAATMDEVHAAVNSNYSSLQHWLMGSVGVIGFIAAYSIWWQNRSYSRGLNSRARES